MGNENAQNENAQGNAQGNADEQQANASATDDEGRVTLTATQYDALLDRLTELESMAAQAGKRGSGGAKTVDELAAELEEREQRQAPRRGALDPNQINQLSNVQLAQLILMEAQNTIATPLLTKLEEIRVKDEIRELRRELKDTDDGDDFEEMKDAIYEVASKNPNLSIKQAYKLAKKDSAPKGKGKGEDSEDDPRERRGNLMHLPPRIPRGERSTHSRGATDRGTPETRTDAASRALEDMEKSGALKF